MQFLGVWHIWHVLIACKSGACGAYAIPPFYAGLECTEHMSCNHQVQFQSIWHIWYPLGYYFVLPGIILIQFILLHIALHSQPYISYGPWILWPPIYVPCPYHMQSYRLGVHMLCTLYMQFRRLQGICHAIIHAILELMTHVPSPHYMQFQSLWSPCHVTIICRSGGYGA